MYLFLATVGAVGALRVLSRRFHLAAFFLLAEPVMRNVTWMHVHQVARSVTMTIFSVAGCALIGWWFRDAAASHSAVTA